VVIDNNVRTAAKNEHFELAHPNAENGRLVLVVVALVKRFVEHESTWRSFAAVSGRRVGR
jgi:hypothetical protein